MTRAFSFSRLFGFLLGSTVAGGLAYYYVYDEYKTANELLTEDINVSCSISYSSSFINPFVWMDNGVAGSGYGKWYRC